MNCIKSLAMLTLLTLSGLNLSVAPAAAVSIPTTFGLGADATIANDEIAINPDTGEPNPANQNFADDALGAASNAGIRMQVDALFLTIVRHRVTVLRFDLSNVTGDFSAASLELHSLAQGRGVDVFALNDSAEAGVENWQESTLTYNNAPGFQSLDPLPTSYVALDPALVTSIGTWGISGPSSGGGAATTIVASRTAPTEGPEPGYAYDPNIAATFSENLSAAIAADTNNLLTLYLTRNGATDSAYAGNNGNLVLLTKEGLAADLAAATPVGYSIAPTLVLPNATLLTPINLVGDYNGDNTVDAADYTVWRDSVGGTTLTNRDSSLSGPVGQADYDAWKSHFGQSLGGVGSIAAAAVPEPTSVLLAIGGVLAGVCGRRSRGWNSQCEVMQ